MNDFSWLNQKSKIFLSGGYLESGESPVQRVIDIARHAERSLGVKGYAERFLNYASKGYYLFSSPVWANFGRSRGLPISCVVGDTWINTKSDGGKLAKDIQVGDEVLTHKNRYRKVTDVIVTERGENI